MTTKTAQFTPGPWVTNKKAVVPCIYGPDDNLIATIHPHRKRDAHLIAAAPAMYEALQAIEARLQGVFDNPALMKQGMLTHDKSEDVIRFVQTALAQAEGRQV